MKLSINFDAFKPLMKDFFSSEESFIKEACQNSERAGASRIDITYDQNERVLLIEDNGKGFNESSWKAFFDICTSDWSADVTDSQKPFGIGALSLLVPSDEVSIWSHNVIESYTDALLTSNDYETDKVISTATYPGAMIGLRIKKDFSIEKVISSLGSIFRGFSVPVFFNGAEIARPHALDSDRNFKKLEFGQINIDNMEEILNGYETSVYLQGYLIPSLNTRCSFSFTNSDPVVIHLESNKFRSRVPDRTDLVSGKDECREMISKYVTASIKTFLLKQFSELSLEAFSLKYWVAAKSYLPTIAKQLPIPTYLFRVPSSVYMTHNSECEDLYDRDGSGLFLGSVVTRSDVAKLSECFYFEEGDLSYHEDDASQNLSSYAHCAWVLHHYMLIANSPFLNPDELPSGHWACGFITKMEDIVDYSITPDASAHSGVIRDGVKLIMCDEFAITLNLAGGKVLSALTGREAIYISGNLFLPNTTTYFGDIIRSIFTCHNGNEYDFELDDFYQDKLVKEFEDSVAVLRSTSIESAIQNLIEANKDVLKNIFAKYGSHNISFDLNPGVVKSNNLTIAEAKVA